MSPSLADVSPVTAATPLHATVKWRKSHMSQCSILQITCVPPQYMYTNKSVCQVFFTDCSTVLPGAEECGVQHRSLASSLIFLTPAGLHSYLRSIGSQESSAMSKLYTQKALWNRAFPNLSLSSNVQPGMFLKNLEIPAWPFTGNLGLLSCMQLFNYPAHLPAVPDSHASMFVTCVVHKNMDHTDVY